MKRSLMFLLTAAGLILSLKILNWIPLATGAPALVRRTTLQELPKPFRIEDITQPTYFPEFLEWPPAEVLSRVEGRALLMQFRNRDTRAVELAIGQSEAASPPIPSRIDPVRVVAKNTMLLKGRIVVLELALCEDGRPCNRISWTDDGTRHAVLSRGAEESLVRFAHGLLPPLPDAYPATNPSN